MERAAAVVVAGIGLLLLTLAALVYAGPEAAERSGGVELAALVTRPALPAPAPPAPQWTSSSTAAPTAAPPTAVASVAVPPTPPSVAAPPVTVPPAAPAVPAIAGVPDGLAALLAEISGGGIRFELGRAELDEGARRLLDRLAPLLLAAHPELAVVVRGHTDSTGGPAINGPLSVRRAEVVAEYLVAHGVPRGRLQVVGLGADAPMADEGTDQGRRANRRSDVTTVERAG